MTPGPPPPSFLITIDVEDWFQVENFKGQIPFRSWSSRQLRVEKNVHRLLDLLDSIDVGQSGCVADPKVGGSLCRAVASPPTKPKATFFVLGWIADRLPGLVREIHARGHEVASHGYHHELCTTASRDDLKNDLVRSRKRLEDILGAPVIGYRAPSFSVTDDVLQLIRKSGYRYDSSYNSFSLNPRYGKILLNGYARKEIARKITGDFYELPVSNLHLPFPRNPGTGNGYVQFPWGGGGYFRLIPFPIFKTGVGTILKRDRAYLFYLHPWEVDPRQPRVEGISAQCRFRHYTNLKRTIPRLAKMITDFHTCRFISCSTYLGRLFPQNTTANGG